MENWLEKIEARAQEKMDNSDSAHDWLHAKRVLKTARKLATEEGANVEVVTAAAYLHDIVSYPKDHPKRKESSKDAALMARQWLMEAGCDEEISSDICHAIEAHSFSANIEPRSLEAKVLQDADRIDALGAIGIARCFAIGGVLNRPIYAAHDSLAKERTPDDKDNTLDHFFTKLIPISKTMKTKAGADEATRRVNFIRDFLSQLETEIS
jgi:uncharacterized protein